MTKRWWCWLLAVSLGMTAGCGESPMSPGKDGPAVAKKDEHDHDHPERGPHGGELIELGNEEYHAELVEDEHAGKLFIYILDSAAKKAVPIEAKELIVNVKHDGKAEQHKMIAAPVMEEGKENKSSRFAAPDKSELHELIEDTKNEARLVVEINGKSYSGKIEHHHAGHDHKHDHKDEKAKDDKAKDEPKKIEAGKAE